MGQQIVMQPDGRYAVWSSVVDDFVLVDATPQEIIDDWSAMESARIADNVAKVVEQLNVGGKPYHQFTMGFYECVERIYEIHGDDSESLKFIDCLRKTASPQPTE